MGFPTDAYGPTAQPGASFGSATGPRIPSDYEMGRHDERELLEQETERLRSLSADGMRAAQNEATDLRQRMATIEGHQHSEKMGEPVAAYLPWAAMATAGREAAAAGEMVRRELMGGETAGGWPVGGVSAGGEAAGGCAARRCW